MIGKVDCGFNKWSIGIDDDGDVAVDFCYDPGYMNFKLCDSTTDELRALAKMFSESADYIDAKRKVAQVERQANG